MGAFLLIVGTTISFKSAPAAAARGAIIIAVKQIVVVAMSLLILYVFNDNLFGISAMVMLAACTGANNAMYAGLMGTMGNEAERGAVAITTLVVGPPVTMIVLALPARPRSAGRSWAPFCRSSSALFWVTCSPALRR